MLSDNRKGSYTPSLHIKKKPKESQRKALILAENSVINGDLMRQLIMISHQILSNDTYKQHDIQKYQHDIQELDSLLKESYKVAEILQEATEKREILELDKNYEENPKWQDNKELIKKFTIKESEKNRELTKTFHNKLDVLIEILKVDGIDFIPYKAPAEELEGGAEDFELLRDRSNFDLLLKNIQALEGSTTYNAIVIGGGHGNDEGMSGIPTTGSYQKKSMLEELITALKDKKISGKLISLGSCEGAQYIPQFKTLSSDAGNHAIVALPKECSDHFLSKTLLYTTGHTDRFFNDAELTGRTGADSKVGIVAINYNNQLYMFEPTNDLKDELSDKDTTYETEWFKEFEKILKREIGALVAGEEASFEDGVYLIGSGNSLQIATNPLIAPLLAKEENAEDIENCMQLWEDSVYPDEDTYNREEALKRVRRSLPKIINFGESIADRMTAMNIVVGNVVPGEDLTSHQPLEAALNAQPISQDVAHLSLQREGGLQEEFNKHSKASKVRVGN